MAAVSHTDIRNSDAFINHRDKLISLRFDNTDSCVDSVALLLDEITLLDYSVKHADKKVIYFPCINRSIIAFPNLSLRQAGIAVS